MILDSIPSFLRTLKDGCLCWPAVSGSSRSRTIVSVLLQTLELAQSVAMLLLGLGNLFVHASCGRHPIRILTIAAVTTSRRGLFHCRWRIIVSVLLLALLLHCDSTVSSLLGLDSLLVFLVGATWSRRGCFSGFVYHLLFRSNDDRGRVLIILAVA